MIYFYRSSAIVLAIFLSFQMNAQVIADFETAEKTPSLSPSGAVVLSNPDKSGINVSDKVGYFPKPASNWQAIYLNFASKQNIGNNDRLTFKLRTSTVGRVFVKIVDGGMTKLENWAPAYSFQPPANQWTECTLDVSSIKNIDFERIEVNASVDNTATADVYVDDFRLYNSLSPNGEPIIELALSPSSKITQGEAIQFDASQSDDSDGTIISYAWDFGDGSTQVNAASINHVYTNDGIFQVTLNVTDNDNNTATRTFPVYVTPSTGKVSSIKFLTGKAATFEKIEGAFITRADYTNPYDPDEVTVDAIVTLPDQSTITVPCFYYQKGYYQSFNDSWAKDNLYAYWMIRFTTSQAGTHKIKLQVKDASRTTTSAEQSLSVAAGTRRGYIKMDNQNNQYYRHTTGEPYYPLGINVAWNSTTNYTTIINNLSEGNANLIRYWQVPFDKQGLEWTGGFYQGLGKFSQEAAAEQDSIINLCEAKNMMLQITIFQHGMFSENVNSNWGDNPYNTAKGGMLSKAEQFFYNAEAKLRTKKLLRYIVARWGYSANLFAWELFNEVQFTGVHPSQTSQWTTGVMTWHDEMGKFIKSIDPFDHIVSTSASDSQLEAMDDLEGLDNLQYHLYNANLLTTQATLDNTLNTSISNKGLINGEYGQDVTNADVPLNMQQLAIWNGIFSQVPHLMWLWDHYTETTWSNLFKAPASFLADKDFVSEGSISKLDVVAKFGTETIGSLGFSTAENFYLIVYDTKDRASLSAVKVDLSDFPKGTYDLTYVNTTTGATTTTSVEITDAQPQVTLPNFPKGLVISAPLLGPITGIENDALKTIIPYPNPTKGDVVINVDRHAGKVIKYVLYNSVGKEIGTETLINKGEPVTLNLKRYTVKAGVYVVRLCVGKTTVTRRIVYAP